MLSEEEEEREKGAEGAAEARPKARPKRRPEAQPKEWPKAKARTNAEGLQVAAWWHPIRKAQRMAGMGTLNVSSCFTFEDFQTGVREKTDFLYF